MDILSLTIVSATVIILALITGRVVLMHKDFVETERSVDISKVAVNEDTIGNQIYTITEDPINNVRKQEHQNTPKEVRTKLRKRYKNC